MKEGVKVQTFFFLPWEIESLKKKLRFQNLPFFPRAYVSSFQMAEAGN